MKVKDYRMAYGISQKKLGEMLGLSLMGYRRKEFGETEFTIEEMRTLYGIFTKYNKKINAGKFFLEA